MVVNCIVDASIDIVVVLRFVVVVVRPVCVRGVWWWGWGHAVGVWGCVPYCVLLLLLSWLFAAACLVVVWGVVGVWVGWL